MRRYRVLFVCIGNACRSQMAEAFANHHGSDILIAQSAGLQPCEMVAPATAKLMREKGLSLEACSPKGVKPDELDGYDTVVNMSGWDFPYYTRAQVREWKVDDPIWFPEDRHRQVRDQIEGLVQGLIAELRNRRLLRR